MGENLLKFIIKRPHFVVSVLLFMSVIGVIGLKEIKQKLFPDSNRPAVSVVITYPGASASEIVETITIPVERALYTISKVRTVYSTTNDEMTVITAEFEYEKDINQAVVDVQNEINKIEGSLPSGITKPQIFKITDATPPVIVIGVYPENPEISLSDVRQIAENQIKNRLLKLKSVANVDVFGGYQKELIVSINKDQLNRYNLPIGKVLETLKKTNRDIPIGIISGTQGEYLIKTINRGKSVEEIKNIPITPQIKLGDIADVSFQHYINRSYYIGNGKEAIAIAVQRQPDGDALKTIQQVKDALKQLKKDFPSLRFEITDTQEKIIKLSNKNMLEALRDAIIMVSIVIFLFLSNFRQMVIASVSIPFVYAITIGIMWLVGLEFNIVTLTGIILTLGMLVDDAVVIIENIERHIFELKKPAREGIVSGTKEVMFPILAGTIATVSVLIPLLFVGDYPEKIFRPLAETLIIAVIVSYFVSITVIPLIAPYLLKTNKKSSIERVIYSLSEKLINPLKQFYISSVKFFMERKVLAFLFFAVFIVLLVVSIRVVLPTVGREIMPPMDTGIVKVSITLDSNLSDSDTVQIVKKISQIISKDSRVEMFSLAVGSEPSVLTVGSGGGKNNLSITIHYIDRFHREQDIWDIQRQLRKKLWEIPYIKYLHVYDYGATPLSSIKGNLDIRISGEDLKVLDKLGNQLLEVARNVKGITSVSRTWDYDKVVYNLNIDRKKALLYGLTPYDIASQIASNVRGAFVSFYTVPNEKSLPLRVIYSKQFRDNIYDITNMYIDTAAGKLPLRYVAQIQKLYEPSQITRQDLMFTIDILGYREKAAISHIVSSFEKAFKQSNINIPAGYSLSHEGDIKQLNDSMKRMVIAIVIGVLFLYISLVPAFGSFLSPLAVIFAVPLSIVGASWSILIMGYHQSMPGLMGIVLLAGIITKNSILLIEFIQDAADKGSSLKQAVLDSIKIRTRPVLMTAVATSVGMIPVALGWALGLERLAPLGIVAIGGLIVGTFLTLIYVPLLYYFFKNIFQKR